MATQTQDNKTTYTIALIGDGGVGKTSFVHMYATNGYIKLNTNYGEYMVNFIGHGDDFDDIYKAEADACIALYTKHSRHDYTDNMVKLFLDNNPNAKLVIVWNKADIKEENEYVNNMCKTTEGHQYIKRNYDEDIKIYQSSNKSFYNRNIPILNLLQRLTNKPDLVFT